MASKEITIIGREPAVYVSTFFNEIVTCRLADGSIRRLLAKRGGVHSDPTYGHRGGPPYEAEVYRRVLEPLRTSAPRFHAMEEDSVTGQTTLLIDYVEDATRLDFAEPAALLDAARWIGEFHRLNEPRVTALAGCVYRYDSSYYLGWAQRALEFSRDANRPWLAALAARFETLAGELLSSSSTVIHGEYYPKNILVRGCEIAPIDWESAAIAAGEIDLASLVEGWDDGDTRACMTEYNRARWPHGAPAEFERRLAIAGMYWAFRWLGDPPEGTTGEDGEWLFKYLRELDEQLGGARE